MGLTERLHSWAVRRPHVLLLGVPGADDLRVAAERRLRERGWVLATSPADADALVVAGAPGDELARAADRVWEQLPGPRARVHAADLDTLVRGLDGLPAALADRAAQQADAVDRGEGPHGSGHRDSGDGGSGDDDMDMDDMDMGGDSGGGMMMDLPGGLAMADREDDRDGLKLDVLHEPLGPALPYWPAGLVLDVVLQGDVVVEAQPRVLPGADPAGGADLWTHAGAADRLDRLTTLLSVAGWRDAAVRAAVLRDQLLARDGEGDSAGEHVGDLLETVARSRTLGLLGRDLPTGDGYDVADHVQMLCEGDAPARLTDLRRLAAAVTGLDVGSGRLVVAALAPDTTAIVRKAAEAAGVGEGGR